MILGDRLNGDRLLVNEMRATYVVRSFLDYRVPVLEALRRELGCGFRVLFSADYVPERVASKVRAVVGEQAIGMSGEKRIGPNSTQGFANRAFRFVYQPGIMRAIEQSQPDVVIGDGFYQWTSFALAHRLRHRTPLVVCYERTFHTERNAQRVRTLYRRWVMRLVDAMAVNGSLSREYSEWLGMSPERITTGQMVADTDNLARLISQVSHGQRCALRQRWGVPGLVFVAVGQLIPRKGLAELLHGWKRLEDGGFGDCVLVLVGAGSSETALREHARALGLRRVVFEGHVDYDAIAPYYASADVFVMPTLEDNWSLVVPEAMACGLPVLCSKYNGCFPELIEPDGNGWVFDPLDCEDTFHALKRCAENRERLAAMGARSREIVADHTPAHAAEAILRACELAIAHRRT